MERQQVIKEAFEEKYGHSKFQVMYGMLSTISSLKVDTGEKEVNYIVPESKTIKKANEDFKLTFSFSITGAILKLADDIKFSLFTSTEDDINFTRIFAASVPEEKRTKIVKGFEMGAELTNLNFEEDTKLTLRVEAIFRDQELIDMINERLSEDEKPIENSVVITSVAARLYIAMEEK